MSNDTDPAITPRESGSIESWPMFTRAAREIASASERAFYARASSGAGGNRRLGGIVLEATRLAEAFSFWEHADPGSDLRRAAIAKLLDLREEAKDLGAVL